MIQKSNVEYLDFSKGVMDACCGFLHQIICMHEAKKKLKRDILDDAKQKDQRNRKRRKQIDMRILCDHSDKSPPRGCGWVTPSTCQINQVKQESMSSNPNPDQIQTQKTISQKKRKKSKQVVSISNQSQRRPMS